MTLKIVSLIHDKQNSNDQNVMFAVPVSNLFSETSEMKHADIQTTPHYSITLHGYKNTKLHGMLSEYDVPTSIHGKRIRVKMKKYITAANYRQIFVVKNLIFLITRISPIQFQLFIVRSFVDLDARRRIISVTCYTNRTTCVTYTQ